jgi:transcriptional regulator with XRE-family HTH domain
MKLTQAELAKEIGVARNTVTRWEIDLIAIPEPTAKLIRMIAAQRKAGKKGAR